jgi:hypothetical protein
MPAHRNDIKAALMLWIYDQGFSLAEVASVFDVTRQSAYKMLKRRDALLRSPVARAEVFFRGDKYTLRDTGYFAKTTDDRCLLHRAMWEDAYGPIPPDHDIHHLDEDKTNNMLANFALHTKSEHGRRHGFGGNQHTGSLGSRPVKW